MLLDGVNFNEVEVAKMSRKDFEERHIDLFWLDRDKATRRKMLREVYERINGPGKETENDTEE